jgi:multiple sugar transport system ATP-binding protein
MASIEFIQLDKHYPNGFHAVRNLNLKIAAGEFVVLVGPSGCGKSTTLRMLAGLEEPTGGEIRIADRRVNELEPGERDLAMVFQNYALYPHMTVRENLSFGLRMRKTPRAEIETRIAAAAKLLGLDDLLDRKPRQLSGGQRQRVAVGRAIVRQPQAFLFDEPLSNLDAKLRAHTRTELAQLHQQFRTTTVYVTHDQVEAMTLGERIVIMHQGQVQQAGAPLEVYHQPANRFVAGFIGSPAMNFLSGSLDADLFSAEGVQCRLNIPAAQRLDGRQVTLGFRPEHLSLNPEHPSLGQGRVTVVENIGSESFVHFDLNGNPIVGKFPTERGIQRGELIPLHLAPRSWHLFATTTAAPRLLSASEIL